ncbi:MAG: ABC transporter permease [Alphaproteobacteria bacterium]
MNQASKDLHKKLGDTNFQAGKVGDDGKRRSLWSDAFIRFKQNKAAVVSCLAISLIVLFAIFGGFFAAHNNENIDWSLLGQIEQKGGPSIENGHYFGVDEFGRDLYARLVQATRISLLVALVGTVISSIIGAFLGAVAGLFGGRLDNWIMRTAEMVISIPYIIFFVVWLAIFGQSTLNVLLVISFINWSSMAILVRGQILALKHKEYVDAARLFGQSRLRIIGRHLLPNMLGIIVISVSLSIPNIIMTESIVSFLGVGVQEPDTSWGTLISEGAARMQYGAIWQLAFPAMFFVIAQVSFYYIGDGLRDALDPKDR